MADIFVSYARSTADQAHRIAQALRALGYGVWRDDELPAHRSYAEVIEERLKAAKAVVVIWSAEAVKSEWVQSEADRARGDRKLVQLTVDGTPLPMPFDRIQCADLNGWTGDVSAPGWRKVVSSIADLVGGSVPARTADAQGERTGISVCVLPFANMSKDEDQEYFADGISEDIITDLSKVSSLWVAARNTAFTFKGKHVDVPQVARQLKVSHVLEGSVRKSGNRVRITAQLIDGGSGGHVWAERYDRDLSDIFALQDEISQAIVSALKLKLFPEEKKAIEDRGTTSLEVYDKYLRARSLLGILTPISLTRAAEMLHEVLAIDPAFSPARGALINTYALMLIFLPEQAANVFEAMSGVVQEALAHAPDQWESHLGNGLLFLLRHDWLGADAAFAKGRTLVPATESDARVMIALFFGAVGRNQEAIKEMEAARGADPLSGSVSAILQQALDIAGRAAEAQAEYERVKDLPGGRHAQEHAALMRLWESGDAAAIEAQSQRFLANVAVPVPVLAQLDACAQPSEALALLTAAVSDTANQDATRQLILGWHAAHFGDRELAVRALRRSYLDMGSGLLMQMWLPVLRETRKTPGFKELIRDLGLHDYWRKSGKWGEFARPLGDDDFEIIG